MVLIAVKNLFHDRGRLAITLAGMVAALVLILFGLAMFNGTLDESVNLVDNSPADVWVMQRGNRDVLNPSVVDNAVLRDVEKMPGVQSVEGIVSTNTLIESDGAKMTALLIGFDLESRAGGPWELESGGIDALSLPGTVIVDESAAKKVGRLLPGSRIMVGRQPQRLVGVSSGAKWFVQPYVFTSIANARALARMTPEESSFLLVNVEPGTDVERLISRIDAAGLVTALPTPLVRRNTRNYMMYESGMGMGVGSMVLAGIIVAAIIISLTVYTATMERIPEFGTLKAMGARRRDVYVIMLVQVIIAVVAAYALGVALGGVIVWAVGNSTILPMHTTVLSLVVVFLLTVLLSVAGSMFSVRKVNRVDPAIVFRT